MTLETFIYGRLSGHAGLLLRVGTRISPMKSLQDSDFPCVTSVRVGGGRDYNHDGPEEMAESLYQFDAWARTHDEAVLVGSDIKDALNSGESPPAGFYCFITDESHGYEPDTKVHRVMIEARIWFRQTGA